jgi:hypothetical protein
MESAVKKYSPRSQLLSRKHIGENTQMICFYPHICERVAPKEECSEVAMETVRFFKHYPAAGAAETFQIYS